MKKRKLVAFECADEKGEDHGDRTEDDVHDADGFARRQYTRRAMQAVLSKPKSDELHAGELETVLDAFGLGEGDAAVQGEDDSSERTGTDQEDEIGKTKSAQARLRKRTSSTRNKENEQMSIHLEAHERYFWDNRPGANKTSNNVLPAGILLNHDEFFKQKEQYKEQHDEQIAFLLHLHESAFDQWAFELRNGFNLCLYGYGSKRQLTQSFAGYLCDISDEKRPKIVVANGYAPDITLMDILNTLAGIILPHHLKLPSSPAPLLQIIIDTLRLDASLAPIYLVINSIDAAAMRRSSVQASLSRLASHPSIGLILTADTPNFSLLWDLSLRRRFRLVFHDCTTFAPFHAEVDAVESVNQLLDRSGRGVGGCDGIEFVLRSLPENARHLFKILVTEQLAGLSENEPMVGSRKREHGLVQGIEYRILYHKAREELICSTEHQLRTLLKEFYDHQIVESRREATGTERLILPFTREDLETMLEGAVS